MDKTQPSYTAFVGFDVSKETVTAYHSQTDQTALIDNTPAAIGRYLRHLNQHCLAICEPTGGHEAVLLEALAEEDIPTHRADARKVKAFIRSLGIHGKTDAIDARALAIYGQERHTRLPLWQIPAAKVRELSALVGRRQELVCLWAAEKNRFQAPVAPGRVKTSCRRLIRLIGQEIADLEAAIQRLIKADDTLRQTHKVLTSIKGVGPVVATTLIATMPELGNLPRR